MNVVEKERTDGHRTRSSVRTAARGASEPKPVSLSLAVDGQLTEVERTFTDRWEW